MMRVHIFKEFNFKRHMIAAMTLPVLTCLWFAVSATNAIAQESSSPGPSTPAKETGLVSKPLPSVKKYPLVSDDEFRQAGYIVPEVKSLGAIIGTMEDAPFQSVESIVYINIGSDRGAKIGDRFQVVSKEYSVKHPASRFGGELLGYLVRILGTLEVVQTRQDQSMAIIREAYNLISVGNLLVPYKKEESPKALEEYKPREKSIEGYIVAFKKEGAGAGKNDILYIDRGSEHNVVPGDLFEILLTHGDPLSFFFDASEKFIPQVIGEVQVISTQQKTSAAVIRKSRHEILVGEKIRYKR
ncbi:MAG: hypothetical protein ACE5DO_15665 [Desulfobacterales bacterium]